MKNSYSLFLFFLTVVFLSLSAFEVSAAARRAGTQPTLTYDLGASTGKYNENSYSEINLGLNWYLTEHVVWRNSLFTRFGSNIDGSSGLDTSARWVANTPASENFVFGVFAGPGYRISNKENSGIFAEAGFLLKAFGLGAGLGFKSLTYNSPGTNSNGTQREKTDTTIFIIVAGGGGF